MGRKDSRERVRELEEHSGELAPTGRKTTWEAVSIYRIVDGKIVEMWAVADELDFLKQLGVIEYKGFPDEVK